jgi:hypothetical protein
LRNFLVSESKASSASPIWLLRFWNSIPAAT